MRSNVAGGTRGRNLRVRELVNVVLVGEPLQMLTVKRRQQLSNNEIRLCDNVKHDL